MASTEDYKAVDLALSEGLGVDESLLVSQLSKWTPDQLVSFKKGSSFFELDGRGFERWKEDRTERLQREFQRFERAVRQWMLHPWERDARLASEALRKVCYQPTSVLIEISCARSSDELLGTRKAFHSLFDRSIEEEVASLVTGTERKLLVALVSSYRYDGNKYSEESTKKEAAMLHAIIERRDPAAIENDEVVRILSTRSKAHLGALSDNYKTEYRKSLAEDLDFDPNLRDTVLCLCSPTTYFSEVLGKAMRDPADGKTMEGLTRVIVTRANVDMEKIKEEYLRKFGGGLPEKIGEKSRGNYKKFMQALVGK